jgi:succinate dehydrogenase / fumarate reductase cytochrome b subunit
MTLAQQILHSSLGRKYVAALTGAGLFVFLIGHLAGNLQVFGPPDLINGYAHFLKSKPLMVWGARLGLLACVALHIYAVISLAVEAKAARPVAYAGGSAYGSAWRSRYMLVSGLVILAFVVYHLAHFTALLPGINGFGDFSKLKTELKDAGQVPDVYAMMVLGFRVWWVTLFYLVAQALLFIHLGHGLSAMFQSLGLRDHVWWPRIQIFAKVFSTALLIGYISIPIAILLGLGRDYSDRAKAGLNMPLGSIETRTPLVAVRQDQDEEGK